MIKGLVFGIAAIAAAFAGGLLSTFSVPDPAAPPGPVAEAGPAYPHYWDSGILVAPVIRDGAVMEYRTLNVILKTGPGKPMDSLPILPDLLQGIYQELLLDRKFTERMIARSVNPSVIGKHISERLTVALPDSDLQDVIVVHADRFAPNEMRKNLIEENHTLDMGLARDVGAKSGGTH